MRRRIVVYHCISLRITSGHNSFSPANGFFSTKWFLAAANASPPHDPAYRPSLRLGDRRDRAMAPSGSHWQQPHPPLASLPPQHSAPRPPPDAGSRRASIGDSRLSLRFPGEPRLRIIGQRVGRRDRRARARVVGIGGEREQVHGGAARRGATFLLRLL